MSELSESDDSFYFTGSVTSSGGNTGGGFERRRGRGGVVISSSSSSLVPENSVRKPYTSLIEGFLNFFFLTFMIKGKNRGVKFDGLLTIICNIVMILQLLLVTSSVAARAIRGEYVDWVNVGVLGGVVLVECVMFVLTWIIPHNKRISSYLIMFVHIVAVYVIISFESVVGRVSWLIVSSLNVYIMMLPIKKKWLFGLFSLFVQALVYSYLGVSVFLFPRHEGQWIELDANDNYSITFDKVDLVFTIIPTLCVSLFNSVLLYVAMVYITTNNVTLTKMVKSMYDVVFEFNFESELVKSFRKKSSTYYLQQHLADMFLQIVQYIQHLSAFVPREARAAPKSRKSRKKLKGKSKEREKSTLESEEFYNKEENNSSVGSSNSDSDSDEVDPRVRIGKLQKLRSSHLSSVIGTIVCLKIENMFKEESSFKPMLQIHERVLSIVYKRCQEHRADLSSITEDTFFISVNIETKVKKTSDEHTSAVNFAIDVSADLSQLNTDYLSNSLSFIQYAIGISTGSVIYGVIGNKQYKTPRLFGPAKEIARYLSDFGIREKMGIVLDKTTHKAVGAGFEKQQVDYLFFPKIERSVQREKQIQVHHLVGRRKEIKFTQWQDKMIKSIEKDKYQIIEECWELFERGKFLQCVDLLEKAELADTPIYRRSKECLSCSKDLPDLQTLVQFNVRNANPLAQVVPLLDTSLFKKTLEKK